MTPFLLITQSEDEQLQEVFLCHPRDAFEAATTICPGVWWELVDLRLGRVIDSAENYHGISG